MGLFRKFLLLAAVAGALVGVSAQPSDAAARWRAYCIDVIKGTPTTEPDGIAHCWKDGVDRFAQP